MPNKAEIRCEAATWLARLHADNRSADDEEAFHIWMAAHPAHASAFESVTEIWEAASALPRDLINGKAYNKEPAVGRRSILFGLGTMTVAAGTIGVWQAAQASVYETGIGERKHVALSDGTAVVLDTSTKLVVRFGAARRLVELKYGRANFRVKRDDRRPFIVQVANHVVTANQSNFDVRRDGDRISVVLIRGQATVKSEDSARTAGAMSDGERLTATSDRVAKLDKPNLLPLLAWQTGQAIFENEDLAQAVEELNRYSTVKLTIADQSIAQLKVSGVYRLGDNAAFARAVAKLLAIQVQLEGNEIGLVAGPPGAIQG